MKYKVIEAWQATYADPIRLVAGERVYLTGHQENWDGHLWLWAKSSGDLEGWIPDNLIIQDNGVHVAKEEYTAVELTCCADETLVGEKETHGWVFCRSGDGRSGWVPRKNLSANDA